MRSSSSSKSVRRMSGARQRRSSSARAHEGRLVIEVVQRRSSSARAYEGRLVIEVVFYIGALRGLRRPVLAVGLCGWVLGGWMIADGSSSIGLLLHHPSSGTIHAINATH